jgi:hypothetical protein
MSIDIIQTIFAKQYLADNIFLKTEIQAISIEDCNGRALSRTFMSRLPRRRQFTPEHDFAYLIDTLRIAIPARGARLSSRINMQYGEEA